MTSTSEKTQPLEIETTSTPRPGIWSFRVTTIDDLWTEASFVHMTSQCEVMAKHFPLVSIFTGSLDRIAVSQKVFTADPHIPVGNAGD